MSRKSKEETMEEKVMKILRKKRLSEWDMSKESSGSDYDNVYTTNLFKDNGTSYSARVVEHSYKWYYDWHESYKIEVEALGPFGPDDKVEDCVSETIMVIENGARQIYDGIIEKERDLERRKEASEKRKKDKRRSMLKKRFEDKLGKM